MDHSAAAQPWDLGEGEGGGQVELSNGLCSISLAIPELELQSSKVELSNGLCSISLAIPELEIQSSKVELSNGLCSISLAIPELEIQSSKVELSNGFLLHLSSYPRTHHKRKLLLRSDCFISVVQQN